MTQIFILMIKLLNIIMFLGKMKNLIIFKFQEAITQSISGSGPRSMDQNDFELFIHIW